MNFIGIKNEYIIEGNTVKILLNSKHGDCYTLIDLEDFNKIKDITCKWYLRNNEDRYAQRTIYLGTVDGKSKNTTVRLHDFIMDCPKGMFVDHINHDTLDNRRCNLRLVECKHNDMNRKGANKNNKSGHRNVFWNKAVNQWQVDVCKNYQRHFIGYFDDLDKAVIAAEDARNTYFGEFAGQG